MLDSVIQFTKIGLEHNLPLNIIKHIISLDHKLIQCDLFKDYSTNIYYQRICEECKESEIACCVICYNHDILIDIGKYCTKCHCWYCGNCCNKISINSSKNTATNFGYIICKCGKEQLAYREYDETVTPNNYKIDQNEMYVKRKI